MRTATQKPQATERYKHLCELNGLAVSEALQQEITLEELAQVETYAEDWQSTC